MERIIDEFDATITQGIGKDSIAEATGVPLFEHVAQNSGMVLTSTYNVSSGVIVTNATVNSGGIMNISGGTATSTTVSGGGLMNISGGTVTSTTVSGGRMNISGGTATATTINSGGSMRIFSGGTATETTVNNGGVMDISGGTATATTVNGGRMNISGGTATLTTVSSGGSMDIYEGGTATETTISSGGNMDIYEGGTVTETTVSSDGYMHILSGTATSTTINSGIMRISSGTATATVNSGGDMYICRGGTATATTVNGRLYISSGGTAIDTTVNDRLYISSGGTATGSLTIFPDATVCVSAGGVIDFDISETAPSNEAFVNDLSLILGSPAYTVTASSQQAIGYYRLAEGAENFTGSMTVKRKGEDDFSIGVGGSVTSGDFVYSLELNKQELAFIVMDTISLFAVNSDWTPEDVQGASIGYVALVWGKNAFNSPAAAAAAIGSGSVPLYITGGTASEAVNLAGSGDVWITGNTTGTALGSISANGGVLHLANDLSASGISGFSRVDFDLTEWGAGKAAMLSVMPQFTGNSNLTVTVSATQGLGTYALVDNVSSFNGSISVLGADNSQLGTVTVGGDAVISGESSYSLAVKEGTLLFTVAPPDTTPPEAPTASADITTPTNQDVTVTAVFSDDSVVKEYSLDGTNWTAYTVPVVLSNNGTVRFRGTDAAGNVSEVTSVVVDNIDKTAPEKPTASADITAATNQDITVTAVFSNDSAVKEYSLDGANWNAYTKPVVFSANGTVYFRGTDAVGNVSEVTSVVVDNIDKTAPEKPTASADITAPTNQDVTVTAVFSDDSVGKEYSLDGANWNAYTSGVVFSDNGTVSFRGTDEAGNVSEVTSVVVDNIDKTAPEAPTALADKTDTTRYPVTVTATFSDDSQQREYSLDGEDWLQYTEPIVFSENGTAYFRGADAAGNFSEVTSYVVENIRVVEEVNGPDKGDNDWVYDKENGLNVDFLSDKENVTMLDTLTGNVPVDEEGAVSVELNGIVYNNFVGEGDKVDFGKIKLEHGAQLSFSLNTTDAIKFTLTRLVEGTGAKEGTYTLKQLQTKTVQVSNKAGSAKKSTDPMLLEAGEYLLEVQSLRQKGGEAFYNVSLKQDKCEFFTKNNNEDDWTDLKANGAASGEYADLGVLNENSLGVIATDWVGYGDAVDYAKFTLESAAKISFTLDATDKATLQLGTLTGKAGKYRLVSKTYVTPTFNKTTGEYKGKTTAMLLEAGTYYVRVKSSNASSGGNADYTLALDKSSLFYPQGDNSDDAWANAPQLAAGDELDDWVGFGDAIDCRTLAVNEKGGLYCFDLSGGENPLKLMVFSIDDGKQNVVASISATANNPAVSTKAIALSGDKTYMLSVEAKNAKYAKNSAYTVVMSELALFTGSDNNTRETATALNTAEDFTGHIAKGGDADKLDWLDVTAFDNLSIEMETGAVKLSFYDENGKSARVAEIRCANGSVRKNTASITLRDGNAITDSMQIAALDDSIRYLKVEAIDSGMNSYRIGLLA